MVANSLLIRPFMFDFRYLDNRVFVSLANGDICVYLRDNGEC